MCPYRYRKYSFLWNNCNDADVDFIKNWMKSSNLYFGIIKKNISKKYVKGYTHFRAMRSFESFFKNYCLGKAEVKTEKGWDEDNINFLFNQEDEEEVVFTHGAPSKVMKKEISEETLKNWKPKVFWFWGPKKDEMLKEFSKKCGRLWKADGSIANWNNYDGEDNVIITNFTSKTVPFPELKHLFGSDPYFIVMKDKLSSFLAKRIYITSDEHPNDIYEKDISSLIEFVCFVE